MSDGRADVLLERAGTTYAQDAGITLRDKPAPLFQLLVLALLLSARISSDIAVAGARELYRSGFRTARRAAEVSRADVIAALGRGHYVRYDESTATELADTVRLLLDRYRGDLRRLAEDAGYDASELRKRLQQFKGIGPTGADIFLREVQAVWPRVGPYFDSKATDAARDLGLPADADKLAALAPDGEAVRLAAALVRAGRDKDLAREVRGG